MRITKAYKGEQPLKGVFHGLSIIWPSNLEYFARIVKDILGGTFDESLFKSEFNNLPTLAKTDSEVILVSGAYKVGFIYGIDRNSNIVPFTFSRSGTATYYDNNGILQSTPINIPRIDYNPVNKQLNGYLLEKSATNLVGWSSPNVKRGLSALVDFQNSTVEGFTGEMKFLDRAGNTATQYVYLSNLTGGSISVENGKIYTLTAWIKMIDNSEPKINNYDINYDMVMSIAGTNVGQIIKKTNLGNGLWRISQTRSIIYNETAVSSNGILTFSRSYSGKQFSVFGYQLVEGTEESSYIPTSGSQVTRPADTLTLNVIADTTIYIKTNLGIRLINVNIGSFVISDVLKSGEYLQHSGIFNRLLTDSEIISLGSTRNELILNSMKYNTITTNSGTYDEGLFTSEFNNLSALVKTDSDIILVPGAYKTGFIYGVSRNGFVVPFTFSRAGIGTYFDKNGLMQTASANVPRIDYDPLTKVCKGYLQEKVGGNFFTKSGFINGLSDVAAKSSTGLMAVDTNWSKGTLLEKGISLSRDTISYAYKPFIFTPGLTYTFSFFAKKEGGGGLIFGNNSFTDFRIVMWGSSFTSATKIIDLGNDIFRVCYTDICPPNPSTAYAGLLKTSIHSNSVVVFTGYQLVEGSEEGTYVPTIDSQVTRPAETLQSITDIIPYTEASVFMNFNTLHNQTIVGGAFYFGRSTSSSFWYSSMQYKLVSRIPNPSSSLDRTTQYLEGNNKVVTSYDTNNFSMNANGSAIVQTKPVGFGFGSGILLFGLAPGFIKNHIKVLVIFSRKLTDIEHTTITT